MRAIDKLKLDGVKGVPLTRDEVKAQAMPKDPQEILECKRVRDEVAKRGYKTVMWMAG